MQVQVGKGTGWLRSRPLLIVVVATLLLGGCGAGPLVRDSGPTGELKVVNKSGKWLTHLMLSPCGGSTHGSNRFPDGVEGIKAGHSYSFTMSPGCWDVLGYFYGGYEIRGSVTVTARKTYTLTLN